MASTGKMPTIIQRSHYDIGKYKRPARVLLFNFNQVRGKPKRTFSARDCAEIYKTFRDGLNLMKSDLQIYADLTGQKVKEKLLEESRRPELADTAMFICVLMSHGYTGHLYDTKGERIVFDELMEYFRGNNCFALLGKPKLFIVQACENDLYQETVADAVGYLPTTRCCIPSEADFFIMWSQIPGHVRWRDPKASDRKDSMSCFVCHLVSSLEKKPRGTITQVMALITRKVCQELEQEAADEFHSGGCRLPYTISTLTRELYLPFDHAKEPEQPEPDRSNPPHSTMASVTTAPLAGI